MAKEISQKQKLINYARNCHFDGLICVKEIKGKRWMDVLGRLECKFDFDIDNLSQEASWIKIKESINKLSNFEASLFRQKR